MSEDHLDSDRLIPPGLEPVNAHLFTIATSIMRLEGKVDKALEAHIAAEKKSDDHEKRIRVLEQAKWKMMGIVVGISSAVSAVTVILKNSGVLPL